MIIIDGQTWEHWPVSHKPVQELLLLRDVAIVLVGTSEKKRLPEMDEMRGKHEQARRI